MTRILLSSAIILSLLLGVSSNTYAGKKKCIVSCSEPDAEIYSNGTLVGKGSVVIIIEAYGKVLVEFKKIGFLKEEVTIGNGGRGDPPYQKSFHMKMRVDDAFQASSSTDIANVYLELPISKGVDEGWKLIQRVILDYFDVIETNDKETGYMRTAWKVQQFTQAVIRTRVVVKAYKDEPLVYKFKLISEISRHAGTSAKADEMFKEWDRVLRKFEPLATELPSRVK